MPLARIFHEHVCGHRSWCGLIGFWHFGALMVIDGEVAVFLGIRPLTPVVYRVPGTAPNPRAQPDTKRAATWKNKPCNG